MATVATQLNSGSGFASGEIVTATKLNNLVNTATVTGIVNADIDAAAAIAASKLALTGAITDTQLATGAVTGAAGGGKIAASAITAQTQLADPLASGDEFLVHDTSASALRRVAWSALQPTGTVLQTVQATNATSQAITANLATTSTPTSTSGDQVLSQTITLSSASNKVLVRFFVWGHTSNIIQTLAAFTIRGSSVIQTSVFWDNQNAVRASISGEILDTPGSVGPHTYSVRLAFDSSGKTFYLNGPAAGVDYGGTSKAVLTLQEIKG